MLSRALIVSLLICSFTFNQFALAEIQSSKIKYSAGGIEMEGELFYDDAIKEKRPGILVVHEWWGLNDYAKTRAYMLATLGYTALALDMYGQGKHTSHPEDAKKFSSAALSDLSVAKSRFEKALEVLKNHASVDPTKTGAIGYCFGGGVVLNMALQGVDLDAVVSFHGGLTLKAPVKKAQVKSDILVCNGADDSFVPDQQIATFKRTLEAANVPYTFKNYPDSKHSFTNPGADEAAKKHGLNVGYNRAADEASWNDMKEFLAKNLG